MKPVTQLVAVSLVAFSCLAVGALTGCSAPTIPTDSGEADENADESDSAQTGKLPPKKTTDKTTNNKPAPASDPAPSADPAPTTPPATPTPTTPTPGADPEACMNQCAAAGPAAQYWTCSANCKDQACDDNCWNPTCGQNAQACESSLDACATQCGLNAGP